MVKGAGFCTIVDNLPTRTATDSRNDDLEGGDDVDPCSGAGGSAAVGAGLDGGIEIR